MRLIERRVGLLFALFLVGLAGAGARVVWLGTVKADALQSAAATQQRTTVEVPAKRGTIADRNGEELAVSQAAVSVAVTPYLIRDPNRVAAKLAPLLGAPAGEVLEKLTRKDTGFVWLARKLPQAVGKRIEKLGIEGIDFVDESKRVYPRKFLASQLLGFVGTDGTGLSGLEQQHEGELHGTDGKRMLVKDALGQPIQTDDEREAVGGRDIRLTIDDRIQEQAEDVLAEVGAKYKPAKGATAIVMDPRDGELLAVANWPKVDANAPGAAPDWARQNRAVQTAYEPGSTFKAFTFAAALQDGRIQPDTMFQLPAQIQIADRSIGEAHDESYGTLSASGILQKSSNVGTITIGQRLGATPAEAATRFSKWVTSFGFGRPTGVDLPGEEAGIVLKRENYSGSSMGNLPIGQGEAVTPMQMVQAYAAIANGGMLRSPRIVKSIGGRHTPTPRGRRVINGRVSAQLRTMLEGVLGPGGTATGAAIPGYMLAGKTGTAEKADPETGGYSKTKYVASFVGFAPATNPRLLTLVMVDEPQGDIYGGSVAAPAWRDITSFALNYLRIPPK